MTVTDLEAPGAHLAHMEEETTEEAAGVQWGALAAVQRLLGNHGVSSCLAQSISLNLVGPHPISPRRWYSPELIVASSQGWRDATVRIGPRSGCYFVTIRNRTGLETVREAQQAANLILAARRGSAA
ncbi:hypothetical protein [Streptosporangium sp. G12]